MTKWGAFALGAVAGLAAVELIKTPAFRKACAGVVSAGIKLKDDAAAFAEAVKEDAEDAAAEKKFNA